MGGIIAGILAIPALLAIVILGPQISGPGWAAIGFFAIGFAYLALQDRREQGR